MASKERATSTRAKPPRPERALRRVFSLDNIHGLPLPPSVEPTLVRSAFTCFGADSAKKLAVLAERVVAALRSLQEHTGFARVQLDEALGNDAEIFHHPFLSGDPVVCCVEGDGAIVGAIQRGMVQARRRMQLVTAHPDRPPASLRVQLVVVDDAVVVDAEGVFAGSVEALRKEGWRVFEVESPAFAILYSGEEAS